MQSTGYRTVGVCVPPDVHTAFGDYAYECAGVTDLSSYFDQQMTVPDGDPGAEALHEVVTHIVSEFATLYDDADFETAATTAPEEYDWLTLAAYPETVLTLRDLFRAASRIQNQDSRVVQTAILRAALPYLSENQSA